jgi:RNA polymerase sigma factor (TIGR02999 family)
MYLKLVDQTRVTVNDRSHFFALAAKVMRHILVDRARRRHAAKRGGGKMAELDEVDGHEEPLVLEILAIDTALSKLEGLDARLARMVELRFFGGLSVEEAAEVLDVSPRTVKRDWQKARAFLHHELSPVDS